jgi:putative addiction module killer protein
VDVVIELRQYATATGKVPFALWLTGLEDSKTQARIAARLDRVSAGNFGDCKPVGGGVQEIRIDYGPGYRVYFAMTGAQQALLLSGATKRRQAADIARAIEYLKDFKHRSAKP